MLDFVMGIIQYQRKYEPLVKPAFLSPEPASCLTRPCRHEYGGKKTDYERKQALCGVSKREKNVPGLLYDTEVGLVGANNTYLNQK